MKAAKGICASIALASLYIQVPLFAVGEHELIIGSNPACTGRFAAVGNALSASKQAEERAILDPEKIDKELDAVADAMQAYALAVRAGDPLAAQKLSESMQMTLGVDPTQLTSELHDRKIRTLRDRGEANKKVSDGLTNLYAELNSIRTEPEHDEYANMSLFGRMATQIARSTGLARAVDRSKATNMTGVETIEGVNARINELVKTGQDERNLTVEDIAYYQGVAAQEHLEALRMQAMAERVERESAQIEPGSELAIAAEVYMTSYKQGAETHLLNERVARDAVNVNLVALQQITSNISTLNTTTRVELGGIATNMATAQRVSVARDMAQVILAVKKTADAASLTVAKALEESAVETAKAHKDSEATRKNVLGLIEKARKTTEAIRM
jgi:hypothetical protein